MWPALQIMQRVKWQFVYSTYLWSLGSRKSRTWLDLWTSSHSPCNVIQKALMVLIELFYNQLRLISWKIKCKIKFEPKLTLFLILEFTLLLSLLALRTHGHCCSMQWGMKQLNMLSRSESAVEARWSISSCQTLMTKNSAIWCRLI